MIIFETISKKEKTLIYNRLRLASQLFYCKSVQQFVGEQNTEQVVKVAFSHLSNLIIVRLKLYILL